MGTYHQCSVLAIAGSSYATLTPPSGETRIVINIAPHVNSFTGGIDYNYNPQVNISWHNGTYNATLATVRAVEYWDTEWQFPFDNTNTLRIANWPAAAYKYGYSTKTANTTTGPGESKITVSSVGTSATIDIQPPSGQTYLCRTVGTDQWLYITQDRSDQKLAVGIYDGTNTSWMFTGASSCMKFWRVGRGMQLLYTNSNRLRLRNDGTTTGVGHGSVRVG